MPSFMIDNTPANYRFKDGNPLSDGQAAFHAALLNAGPAAAEVRRQRERDAVGDAFRSADDQRANKALELQQLWHQESGQRADRNYNMDLANRGAYRGDDFNLNMLSNEQAQRIAAQIEAANAMRTMQETESKARIKNMEQDNARANMQVFGSGVNEAAKRAIEAIRVMFQPAGRQGYSPIVDNLTGEKYSFDRATGKYIPAVIPGTGPLQPGAGVQPGASAQPGASTGQAAPLTPEVSTQDMDAWLSVLGNPKSPSYRNSIAKLQSWMKGIEHETGKKNPVLVQRAQAIIERMRAQQQAGQTPVSGNN